jgi:hypothetical protein
MYVVEKLRHKRTGRQHAGNKQGKHADACDVGSFVQIFLYER